MTKLSSSELRRFWFKSNINIGVGITAYSLEDALVILDGAIERHTLKVDVVETVEDVDIQGLDQGHVIPNMNPPNFRGVWFPMLNENLRGS
jgi:hypothetical protein